MYSLLLEDIPDEEDALRYAAPAADAIPLSAAVEMMRSQSAAALLPTPPPGILGPAVCADVSIYYYLFNCSLLSPVA